MAKEKSEPEHKVVVANRTVVIGKKHYHKGVVITLPESIIREGMSKHNPPLFETVSNLEQFRSEEQNDTDTGREPGE